MGKQHAKHDKLHVLCGSFLDTAAHNKATASLLQQPQDLATAAKLYAHAKSG